MKISDLGSIKSVGTTRKSDKSSSVGSAFSDLLADGTEETAPAMAASDISATAALSQLLALQEISEEEVQRKKMLQKGHNLLDSLEKLRRQLLMGEIPGHMLVDIGRQLSIQKQNVSDPALMALIDDIELRAAVEQAKLEMAAAARIQPEDLDL
jgi:hypothetical protein